MTQATPALVRTSDSSDSAEFNQEIKQGDRVTVTLVPIKRSAVGFGQEFQQPLALS